jgi:hypothetical protein
MQAGDVLIGGLGLLVLILACIRMILRGPRELEQLEQEAHAAEHFTAEEYRHRVLRRDVS